MIKEEVVRKTLNFEKTPYIPVCGICVPADFLNILKNTSAKFWRQEENINERIGSGNHWLWIYWKGTCIVIHKHSLLLQYSCEN